MLRGTWAADTISYFIWGLKNNTRRTLFFKYAGGSSCDSLQPQSLRCVFAVLLCLLDSLFLLSFFLLNFFFCLSLIFSSFFKTLSVRVPCATARSAWRQLGWGSVSSAGPAWSSRKGATECRAAVAASCATSAESPSLATTTSASTPALRELPADTAASAPCGPTPR